MERNKYFNWVILVVFVWSLAFGAAAAPAYAAAQLSDINGHWAQAAIQKMADAGIVSGNPDGTFQPDKNISRAEFATLIVKAFNLEPQTGKVFTDTVGHWAEDAISTANANGIVSGYGDKFGPDDPITNEQMAVMIVKAAKLAPETVDLTFLDSDKISAWAKNDVTTAFANKLIVGSNGYFNPQSNASKAQAVVLINAALNIGEVSTVASVTASPAAGSVSSGTEVKLSCATADATIYYTTDGTTPTTGSTVYSSAVKITKAVTIKAMAAKEGMSNSAVSSFVYTIKSSGGGGGGGSSNTVQSVTASPAAGAVASGTAVTLSCATADATIYYTLNGTTPTDESLVYSDPITITADTTIKAFAAKSGKKDSSVKSFAYTIANGTIPPQVESVVINEFGGQIYVTVILKADLASTVDKVFVNGEEAISQGDGVTFKKTLDGDVDPDNIIITVQLKSNDYTNLPDEVESIVANEFGGQTFVTVILKADLASTVDKVFINGEEAISQGDGVTFKKTLSDSVATNDITITIQNKSVQPTELIVKSGCTLVYVDIFQQTRALVQTDANVTSVTANGDPMVLVDGKWQCDFDGNVASVTIIATDGTNDETYELTQ